MDVPDREPLLAAALETPHVGLGDAPVLGQREEQRDVDVDSLVGEFLDRLSAFDGAGHLDHHVRQVQPAEQVKGFRDRSGRVVRQAWRHFEADEAVHALRPVVHRAQDVRGQRDVPQRKFLVDLGGTGAHGGQCADLAVVVGAASDGLFEDGRVRGHAAHPGGDIAGEAAVEQVGAQDVVDPDALTEFLKLDEVRHDDPPLPAE